MMKARMIARRTLILSIAAFAVMAAAPAPVSMNITPPPEVAANPANRWTLHLSNGGTVVILLRPDLAPKHVARIQQLTRSGFYNGLTFHRVIPGFMAQGGDPQGTGEGGSPLPDLQSEFSTTPFLRGMVGAARAQDLNSANSQFFIMYASNADLDFNYTVVGRVIGGMDAVDKIAPGEPPADPTKIVSASIGG